MNTKRGKLAIVAASVTAIVAGVFTVPAHAATTTINVLMVGNPQMKDLQSLTDANFTPDSGIKVNYTVLPENELRDKVTQDVASGAGQYDVVTLGMYDIANWGGTGKLKSIDSYVASDSAWNKADVFPSMIKGLSGADGKLYAAPFYGESSMLMYRKDLAAKAGAVIPLHPTWQQVATAAAKMNDPKNGVAGICLRGLPGWGEQFAPLTTVVNTFGGTWFTKDWKAQVSAKPFNDAVSFYVNLLKKSGEKGATQAGFNAQQGAYNAQQAQNAGLTSGLLGHCLSEKMEIFPQYRSALIWLSSKELKKFDFHPGDTEGFVNYPLSIKGVVFSAFFMVKNDLVIFSFRSKGSFPTNEFCAAHFNGGGHRNASGGETKLPIEEALALFRSLLPQYSEELEKDFKLFIHEAGRAS